MDFIFYPYNKEEYPGIILELKIDSTPQEAIAQINDKKYELRLKGKLGEKGLEQIVKVGISYNPLYFTNIAKNCFLTSTALFWLTGILYCPANVTRLFSKSVI